jgi:hypothetical protein
MKALDGRSIVCCLFVGFVLAGCSSGGGMRSTPTTREKTTSAPAFSTPVGTGCFVKAKSGSATQAPAPCSALKLGTCPRKPTLSVAALNADVRGLYASLVPIRAVRMRACQYSYGGRLIASQVFGRTVTVPFENETNRLASVPQRLAPVKCGPNAPSYVVTLANQTQQVRIASYHCGDVVNGAIVAVPTREWLIEMQRYTPPGGVPRQ